MVNEIKNTEKIIKFSGFKQTIKIKNAKLKNEIANVKLINMIIITKMISEIKIKKKDLKEAIDLVSSNSRSMSKLNKQNNRS